MSATYMPLTGTGLAIRMDALSESRAQKNHGQSLKRLAERGGVSACEASALIDDREWRSMRLDSALLVLLKARPPIDMVLHCPACGTQHIDAPDRSPQFAPPDDIWTNPPHRSHLCHNCGHVWRPADVATNGVQAVQTRGKNDSEKA